MSWFWTEEQTKFLVKNYKKMPMKEIAFEVGRSENTCRNKARKIGLINEEEYANIFKKANKLQEKAWEFILENPGARCEVIAEHLNVTPEKASKVIYNMTMNNYLFYVNGEKYYPMEHLREKKQVFKKPKITSLLGDVETCGVGGSYMIENGVPRWI